MTNQFLRIALFLLSLGLLPLFLQSCSPPTSTKIQWSPTLTALSFPSLSVNTMVSESSRTASAYVAIGVPLTSLVAKFSISGAMVKVGSVVQTSGVTANDFSEPTTYTVFGNDGISKDYVVTLTPINFASTWTDHAPLPIGGGNAVAYGNGRFVAVGYGGVATSSDGHTWTGGTIDSQTWSGVAFGGIQFVTIGSGSSEVESSYDGLSWVPHVLPSTQSWSSVAYGGGRFVAIAFGSSGVPATTAFSTDGANWSTGGNLPNNNLNNWACVTYGNGVFLAVGPAETVVATSPDGVTWTPHTVSSPGWTSVTYGGSHFVAVNQTTAISMISADGTTWNATGTLPALFTAVTSGVGLYVAVVQSTSIAATSTDGLTWTTRTLPVADDWSCLAFGGGTFVIVSNADSEVVTSP